ncbi:penicillin-binding protein activator [Sphingobium phenoxybenzoativorans]
MTETGAGRQAGIWSAMGRSGRILFAACTLLVAACQSIVPKGTGPTPPPVTTQPGVEQGLPTDTLRNRVALLVPMTGPNAGVGQSIANATTLALLDSRTEKVRVTTYDTNLGAGAAAQKAIAEGNKLILGPLIASDVRAVSPIAQKAGVPVISFSNDSSVAGNGTYLMGYSPTQSIERVITYARGKGLTRFAALVPRGVYGERSGNALLRTVESAGGTVVSMQTFDRSAGSFAAAVQKLPQGDAYDAILIADSGRTAIQIAPLVRKRGAAGARILGTELWNTESALAGNAAVNGAWFASVSDTYYRQLATKYRARFGAAPFRLSSLGYDAVLLTVKMSQEWKPGTPFPARRLSDAGGFTGIDGAFRFGANGVAERALEVSQINPGSFTVIDAAPRGFGQ